MASYASNMVQSCIQNKLAEYEERFGGVNEDLRGRASFECDPPGPD